MTIVMYSVNGNPGGNGPVIHPPNQIAARPGGLDGAMQTWTETTKENAIRTNSDDNQMIKTRQRATNVTRTGDASVTVQSVMVALYKSWYLDACRAGTLPTRFKLPPSCTTEEVWRFAAPPTYDFSIDGSGKVCKITMKLEQLPNWYGV